MHTDSLPVNDPDKQEPIEDNANHGVDSAANGKPADPGGTGGPAGGTERAGESNGDGRLAASASTPTPVATKYDDAPTFRNFIWDESGSGDDSGEKPRKIPRRVPDIAAELVKEIHPGWPKRIGKLLFVNGKDYQPIYLDSAPRLFAFIDAMTAVDWTPGGAYVSQERFYQYLTMAVKNHDAIETLPHFPPIDGIYYMHKPIPDVGAGGLLDELGSMFCASAIDRELIKALVCTLFWGGPAGKRPAFLVTAKDDDSDKGRGVGKSTLIDILSDELAGGSVNVSPTETIPDIKTRLLSSEDGRKRVVRLDNVKTLRFSWADLENEITSAVISGKALYRGEGRRPNTLTWLITLNGASLSKDMAQRVIAIVLDRPDVDGTWEDRVRSFIRANRPALLAEIRERILGDPGTFRPITRWTAWETDILSKMDDPPALQGEIMRRQKSLDADDETSDIYRILFIRKITLHHHNPDIESIWIPSAVAAQWISELERKPLSPAQATGLIRGLNIANLRKSDRNGQRGWLWTGDNAPLNQPTFHLELRDALPDNIGDDSGSDGSE